MKLSAASLTGEHAGFERTQMSEETYYIGGDLYQGGNTLPEMGHLTQCSKCKRKILVAMALIGSIHHAGLAATCADCLELTPEFKEKHPDVAEKIEKWKEV
jgi:hypothetical protein